MAEYSQSGRLTRKAAADLSALQYTCVKLDTNGNLVAATAATDKVLGILQNAPVLNGYGDVLVRGASGTSKAKLGGTVAAGDNLTSDGSGRLITTVTGGNEIVARATRAGVVNEISEVLVGSATDRV